MSKRSLGTVLPILGCLLAACGGGHHHPPRSASAALRIELASPRQFAAVGAAPQPIRPPSTHRPSTHRPSLHGLFRTVGSPVVGEMFTVTSNGGWTNNPTNFAYQWVDCDSGGLNCTPIGLDATHTSTSSFYTVQTSDIGHTIRVQVTGANAGGSGPPNVSAATGVVPTPGGGVPVNTVVPTITGTTTQGQVLTEHDGSWTNTPTSHAYQWQSCDSSGTGCSNITGATSSTYTLVVGDVGHKIVVLDTASNAAGAGTAAASGATAVIAASGGGTPANTVAPAVTGTATQGSVLTTTNGTWTNTPTSFTYQWQDCDSQPVCTNISAATGSTYTLAASDVNQNVRAVVTATNGSGSTSANSNLSSLVQASGGGSGGAWNGTAETGAPSTVCNKYVSTAGSDSYDGTAATHGSGSVGPWLTINKLAASLPTGQTGCLESGTYGSTSTTWWITTPNITITAAPGATVTINGSPHLEYQATGSTLSYLNIDENYVFATSGQEGLCANTTYVPLPLEVDGNNDTIIHDNIYQTDVPAQDRTNGIGVGWNPNTSTHTATGVTITDNRIHDFGNSCGKAHGIYEAAADHSTFSDNWFWGDPAGGACIQITDSHPLPEQGPHDNNNSSNVCDNVNIGFFLYGESAYYQNITIQHNIIRNTHLYGGVAANSGTSSTIQFINNDGTAIADGWPCGPNGGCGAVFYSGNISSAPGFADSSSATTHDYRVTTTSPAAGWGMWDGDYGSGTTALMGNSNVSSTAVALDADYKRGTCFTAGQSGTINRLTIHLEPNPGVNGTQSLEGVVYLGSSGALLAHSTTLSYSTTEPSGWYNEPLTSPLSVTSGTSYCLTELSGALSDAADVRVAISTGTLFYNANVFASGPSDPFGTASTGSQTMSMFAAIN